jgi:hypothetical protein
MKMMASLMKTALSLLTGTIQHAPHLEAMQITNQAIEAIENDKGFSDENLKDAVMVISNNLLHATAYLGIKSKVVQSSYILELMKDRKGDK